MKRSRGRGRRPQQNNHNRSFDSTGPDIKIRGTAAHVYEKYLQLARDASTSGDRVQAENYLQHAEHYYRIMMAAQAANPMPQGQQGQPSQPGQPNGNGNGGQPGNGNGGQGNGGEAYAIAGSGPSFGFADDQDDGDDGDDNMVR